MIPKECKRFAEVDFPIAVVSEHSAREMSIGHRITEEPHHLMEVKALSRFIEVEANLLI
jgi:hypothetical protein